MKTTHTENRLVPSHGSAPKIRFVFSFRSLRMAPWLLPLAVVALAGAGCSKEGPSFKTKLPATVHFFDAQISEDKGMFGEAQSELDKVVHENPGTRFANFAYLKLGDVYARKEEWDDAIQNYEMFLSLDPSGNLTPYVLYKLFEAHYKKTLTGLINPTPEVERNASPNLQLLVEFKRFYLLYPKSVYIKKITPYYLSARETLAQYERLVGDFYFRRKEYTSASGRYLYLLRNFPEYPHSEEVVKKLIESYRRDQEISMADEMERVYRKLYGAGGGESGGVSQSGGGELPPKS
ncbi:MAG: outer membrane protein assembly factor BamD [Deltaproteobacteria bacterium]|nr:outer membrane protein assembly factor BamD [Deltaproteobacteria bacterium]